MALIIPAFLDRPPPPSGVFAPRRRACAALGGWPAPDRIGLPLRAADKSAARSLGARDEGYGQMSCLAQVAGLPAWQAFVPFAARREFVPLLVEPIPQTAWAASLKNLLDDEGWKALRRPWLADASRLCEVCGDGGIGIECHEIWEYGPVPASGWGRQRLVALAALCGACHEMFHPGRAGLQGRGPQVRDRLAAVNQWTRREVAAWSRWAQGVHTRRGRVNWVLDLTLVAAEAPFTLREGWRSDGDGQLSCRRRYGGTTVTRVEGADFAPCPRPDGPRGLC